MLPPFRVRTLRHSTSPLVGRSKSKEFNALVQITAPEYDKTLRVCPKASLKYLDEEDGEIVTVGSSFELIQCLESPSQQNPHNIGLIPRVSLPNRQHFSEAPPASTVHQRIFHIESRPSSLQLWREIEERSKRINITPLPHNASNELQSKGLFTNPHDVQLPPNSISDPCPMDAKPSSSISAMMRDIAPESDLKVQVDASDELSQLQEPEDYRIASLNASIRLNITQAQEGQSRNCPKNVVGVPFNPADGISSLAELTIYGLKPHGRRDPPATDEQPGAKLKPSLKESPFQDRYEPVVSQQQHDAHTWSRSGDRHGPSEFPAALEHVPETYGREENGKQSLLNLFEAELARVPSPSAHTQNEARKGKVHVKDVFSMRSAFKSKDLLDQSTELNDTNLDQNPQTPAQVCIQALNLGLGTALSSFHACMNDIVGSVQQASEAVQSADRSRIESVMASFRSFAREIAASANVVEQNLKSEKGMLDQGETIAAPNKDNRGARFLSEKVQGQVIGGEPLHVTTTGEPKRSAATEQTASFKDVSLSRSESALSSQHDAPFGGKAQDELTAQDWLTAQDGLTAPAEDKIALWPSLNKSNTLFKQDCDDARVRSNLTYSNSYPRTSMSFMERVPSDEELHKTVASQKVIAGLPTFKQFEDGVLATTQRFPPLPSREALEPHRPSPQPRFTRRLNTRVESPCIEKDSDHETSTPDPLRITSVTIPSDRCESSGEFFNRMTGLGKESITNPHSSLQASVDKDSAGLDVGLAQDDPFLGQQKLAFRQTVSGLARTDNFVNTRRPYSENFSGEGRIGWDTFLSQGSESLITDQEVEPIPSSLTSDRGHVPPFGFPNISSDNIQNDEVASEARRAVVNQHSEQSNPNDRGDAAYVRKVHVQSCIAQLQNLGYGANAAQGSIERLTVYAQAAEGDLNAAIDIIDEEQRAYSLGLQG